MSWFKCKHPLAALAVEKEQTEEPHDDDFLLVTYNLLCTRCNTMVSIDHVRCIGGVSAFMANKLGSGK